MMRAGWRSWGWNEPRHAARAAGARLRAAPAAIPRQQPDRRGVRAAARPHDGVCARGARTALALCAAAAVWRAAAVLERARRGARAGRGRTHRGTAAAAGGAPDKRLLSQRAAAEAGHAPRSAPGAVRSVRGEAGVAGRAVAG